MDFPSDAFFSLTLKKGTIYKFPDTNVLDSGKSRPFIVLNNPNSEMIILCYCTSQYESQARYIRKVGHRETSLVMIEPDCTNQLTKTSYVNCNNVIEKPKSFLKDKLESSNFEVKGELSDKKLNEIISEVIQSRQVPPYIKAVLRKE